MDDTDRIDQLEAALAAALERISDLEASHDGAGTTDPAPTADATAAPEASRLGRRQLLTRGGTAAVGAVLGGTAAAIASASPAAAATGSFDSSTSGSALTLANTGPGPAMTATTVGPAPAVTVNAGTGIVAVDVEAAGVSTGLLVVGKYNGILARATNGLAAFGIAGESHGFGGAGVSGQGTEEAAGVWGYSPDGIGVKATGATAPLLLANDPNGPAMPAPPTRSDAHVVGELYLDDAAVLWLCTAGGTPGSWSRIGGAGTAGAFTVLPSPVRVYDSRPDYLPTTGPKTKLTPGVDRVIDCTTNTSGIPTDANALAATITITNPTGPGWLSARANGATFNGTSTLNWTTPDAIVATTTTSALGPAATIALRAHTPTDAIVDVIGYWR